MIRDLQKRLRKLECTMPRRQPEPTQEEKRSEYLHYLVLFAISNFLGDPILEDAPVVATARALGYEPAEFLKVLHETASGVADSEFDHRYADATRKLFAKFGVNLDASDWKETVNALKRMEAGLSKPFKELLMGKCSDRPYELTAPA